MFAFQVFEKILEARHIHYQYRNGKWTQRAGQSRAIKDFESALKHPLFPDNAYVVSGLREWNLFAGVPSCELHALTLGLFEHIAKAIFYGYKSALRRPDLVDSDGKPLVGDLRLNLHVYRLEKRLQDLDVDKSVINFRPCQVGLFHKVYHDQDSGTKMTGDNVKRLMLLLPFVIRDLITPEVLIPGRVSAWDSDH